MVKMTLPSNGPGFGVLLSLIVHPIKLFESQTCQVADAPENYSNPPWQQQKYAPKDVLVKNCPTIAFGLWSEIRHQISCMFLYHIYSNYICISQLESKWFLFFPSLIYSGRSACVEILPLLLQLKKLLCCIVTPLLSQIYTITNQNRGSLVASVIFLYFSDSFSIDDIDSQISVLLS